MKSILLAESSITIQKVVELSLYDQYEVVIVDDGAKAIEMTATRKFDLVISSVSIRGKNGYEVTEALKGNETTRGIPVLLLTGTFEPFDKNRATAVGVDAWIDKPFNTKEFVSLVRKMTGELPAIDDEPAIGELESDGFWSRLKRLFGSADR